MAPEDQSMPAISEDTDSIAASDERLMGEEATHEELKTVDLEERMASEIARGMASGGRSQVSGVKSRGCYWQEYATLSLAGICNSCGAEYPPCLLLTRERIVQCDLHSDRFISDQHEDYNNCNPNILEALNVQEVALSGKAPC
eukprot:6202506-Pleurochrysis_carterae.AAC.3